MITHHWSLVSVLKVPPEREGSVEYLGTVTADCTLDAQLQLLAIHLMDLLQVGQHLLPHGVFEDQKTPGLWTLVVEAALRLGLGLRMVGVELEQMGDNLGLRLEPQLAV